MSDDKTGINPVIYPEVDQKPLVVSDTVDKLKNVINGSYKIIGEKDGAYFGGDPSLPWCGCYKKHKYQRQIHNLAHLATGRPCNQ